MGLNQEQKDEIQLTSCIFYTETITGKIDTHLNPISAINCHNTIVKILTKD